MRKNPVAYKLYVDFFFGSVRGKKEWRKLKSKKCLQDCSTVNDEAYGLLVLENYWEVWEEMKEKGRKTSKGLEAKTLFTVGGQGQGGTKKHRGWNIAGMERFTELVQQIRKDREENRGFDEEYLHQMIQEKMKSIGNSDTDEEEDEEVEPVRIVAPREALSDDE